MKWLGVAHPRRETSAMFAGAGMMAADGRCKTLDAAADGYVRGEAVVLIKLRRPPHLFLPFSVRKT